MQKTLLDPFIGQILNNRYLIRDLIGKGGTGKVYLAEDAAKAGMPVAVKILSQPLASHQMRQSFTRQIFVSTQLGRKSNYIIRVLSYGIHDDNIPFYVMEYLSGKSLKDIIETQDLPLEKILNFCYQICLALQCAHQGVSVKGKIYPIIHQDINPENIFITQDDRQGETIKILDFGLSNVLSADSPMSISDSAICSFPYCSPEQMDDNQLLDARADIYSLGVLMYEMLTAEKPLQVANNSFGSWYEAHNFQTPRPFEVTSPNLNLPRELKNLVYSCLAKNPSDRPASIREILQTLDIVKQQLSGQKLDSNSDTFSAASVQLVPTTFLSAEACRQKTWPQNKPIAPIVFPHLLPTTGGTVATLWAMMPKQDIEKYQPTNSATEFITTTASYPMLMWIAVLGVANLSGRWLHYFLDLKDVRGQQTVLALAKTGYYHLLLFPLEEPNSCAKVITFTLNQTQRQKLLDLLDFSQKSHTLGVPQDSKNLLKAEYEKSKPEILRQLVANQTKNKLSLREWLSKSLDNCINLLSRT